MTTSFNPHQWQWNAPQEATQDIYRGNGVQAMIDAARLEGIRLGLEAAARESANWFGSSSHGAQEILANIRALDPATIAKETAR
jgi:hypothetical protein